MALSINDIKSGLTILLDGQLYVVSEYQHVKPGKGAAFVRIKLRNMKSGLTLERTFRGDEKIEEAFIEERKMQYMYHSDKLYYFMDQDNFEQIPISEEVLGKSAQFLKDAVEVSAYFFKDEIINVVLPIFVELAVLHTAPGLRGDTAKSATKQATLETGAVVSLPIFIEVGDVIKIDTRTGEYIERVK